MNILSVFSASNLGSVLQKFFVFFEHNCETQHSETIYCLNGDEKE